MKIFKSKKIMIAAIAVFVISSIGLTTAALTTDQMKKSSLTNIPVLGGLNSEELQKNNALASETQTIVIIPNDDQTTAAATAPAATTAALTEISADDDQTDAAAPTNAPALAELSVDSVKQIVSAKTPGAVITEWDLDKDDGKLNYEVDAILGQTEYEYKIDAYTGVILEYDADVEDMDDEDDMDDVDGMDDVDDEGEND